MDRGQTPEGLLEPNRALTTGDGEGLRSCGRTVAVYSGTSGRLLPEGVGWPEESGSTNGRTQSYGGTWHFIIITHRVASRSPTLSLLLLKLSHFKKFRPKVQNVRYRFPNDRSISATASLSVRLPPSTAIQSLSCTSSLCEYCSRTLASGDCRQFTPRHKIPSNAMPGEICRCTSAKILCLRYPVYIQCLIGRGRGILPYSSYVCMYVHTQRSCLSQVARLGQPPGSIDRRNLAGRSPPGCHGRPFCS